MTARNTKKRTIDSLGQDVAVQGSAHQYFLPFHLQVLKSLYKDDGGNDADDSLNNASSSLDWSLVEEFLRTRSTLLQWKDASMKCLGIYQHAMEFVVTTSSFGNSDSQDKDTMPSPMKGEIKPGKSPSRSASTAGSVASLKKKIKRGGSFGIVTRFLGHRSDRVQETLQKRVSKPFASLLEMTQQQIAFLLKSKQKHHDIMLDQQQVISREFLSINVYAASSSQRENVTQRIQNERQRSVDEQSKLAATESKLQLWLTLQKELKQVLL